MHSDVIMLRHSAAGAPHILAARHELPTSSTRATGATSTRPRPCWTPSPSASDIRALRQDPEAGLDGVRVAIIGDVEHSRVARSNIMCLNKLGASVILCGPSTLMPAAVERMGVEVTHNLREAIDGADVIYSLRIQLERQQDGLFPSLREYIRLFRIDTAALAHAKARRDHHAPRPDQPRY
jgi:aspartate carbamoyltransferase catalytic subunit